MTFPTTLSLAFHVVNLHDWRYKEEAPTFGGLASPRRLPLGLFHVAKERRMNVHIEHPHNHLVFEVMFQDWRIMLSPPRLNIKYRRKCSPRRLHLRMGTILTFKMQGR